MIMKNWQVATFNVNGIRARQEVLLRWLQHSNCQVVGIQETKVQNDDFPITPFVEQGYQASFVGQKSFNGVAVLSTEKPDEVRYALPGAEEQGARFIAARFGRIWVINSYIPQGRAADNPAFQDKLAFIRAMGAYIKANSLHKGDMIWLGDINVAPHNPDVHDPVKLKGQMGFHPDEQRELAQVMADCGLKDLFREKNPDAQEFSFWDYRVPNGFKRNLGWRIDHLLVSQSMLECCEKCWIEKSLRGQEKPSDHVPVIASFKV